MKQSKKDLIEHLKKITEKDKLSITKNYLKLWAWDLFKILQKYLEDES